MLFFFLFVFLFVLSAHIFGLFRWFLFWEEYFPSKRKLLIYLFACFLFLVFFSFVSQRVFDFLFLEQWSLYVFYFLGVLKGLAHIAFVFGLILFLIQKHFQEKVPFWFQATFWFLPICLTMISLLPFSHKASVKHEKFYHPDLPESFNHFKIGIVTDLHLGPTIRSKSIQHLKKSIEKESPDILVFLGDIFEAKAHIVKNWFKELVLSMPQDAPVFFVWGNHEYIHRDIEAYTDLFNELGVRLLLDEEILFHNGADMILIGGTNDQIAKDFGYENIRFDSLGHKEADFKLMLSHRPDTWKKVCELGYHLQLSGHTHGGQFYPFRWLVKLYYGSLSEGWFFDKDHDCAIYTSAGTGYYGVPMRLGTKSEFTLLKLFNK